MVKKGRRPKTKPRLRRKIIGGTPGSAGYKYSKEKGGYYRPWEPNIVIPPEETPWGIPRIKPRRRPKPIPIPPPRRLKSRPKPIGKITRKKRPIIGKLPTPPTPIRGKVIRGKVIKKIRPTSSRGLFG